MSIKLCDTNFLYMPKTPYEQIAVADINLEIQRGEFVGIIGHTGSGKSTLVQLMSGLLQPTSGSVTVDAIDLHSKKPEARQARRRVGMVFQYPEHQIFEETIYADIAFGPRNMGLDDAETRRRVEQAMNFVGLDFTEFAQRSPFQLSGGQMRRVALAGVIALEPEYLILDEPSAGLDPRGREEIFGEIINLYRTTGITVVLVSHNMEEIARMAKRLIVMKHGRIVLDGSPQDIFQTSRAELQGAGVDVPAITSFMAKCYQSGLAVDTSVITVDQAVESLLSAARRRQQ